MNLKSGLILFNFYSRMEEALSDLNEAVKVAPAGRDVRRILLKAIEETENARRLQPKGESDGESTNKFMLEKSLEIIHDCSSSGVGSSLTSERG